MNKNDVHNLDLAIDQLVLSSISRMRVRRDMLNDYMYTLDLKEVLHRERLKDPIIDEAVAFLNSLGMKAVYYAVTKSIQVVINMATVVLTPSQCVVFNQRFKLVS